MESVLYESIFRFGVVLLSAGVIWLIKSIVALQKEFIEFKTMADERFLTIFNKCKERGEVLKGLDYSLRRIDKNVSRLCEHAGIREDTDG